MKTYEGFPRPSHIYQGKTCIHCTEIGVHAGFVRLKVMSEVSTACTICRFVIILSKKVFGVVGLSFALNNYWSNFPKMWWQGVAWVKEEHMQFWSGSDSRHGSMNSVLLSLTLQHLSLPEVCVQQCHTS